MPKYITPEELQQITDLEERKRAFDAEMKRRIDELKAFEQFEVGRLNTDSRKIWDNINEKYQLDPKLRWGVNRDTGELRGVEPETEGCGDPNCLSCKLKSALKQALADGRVEVMELNAADVLGSPEAVQMGNINGTPFSFNVEAMTGKKPTVH